MLTLHWIQTVFFSLFQVLDYKHTEDIHQLLSGLFDFLFLIFVLKKKNISSFSSLELYEDVSNANTFYECYKFIETGKQIYASNSSHLWQTTKSTV